jgi:hypothetical protein
MPPGMDQRQLRSIAKRTTSISWAMLIGFLLLAHPAHAAIDSEPGALLLQAGGAGLLGALFAIRKTLKRSGRSVPEFFADSTADRAALARVSGDIVGHARS